MNKQSVRWTTSKYFFFQSHPRNGNRIYLIEMQTTTALPCSGFDRRPSKLTRTNTADPHRIHFRLKYFGKPGRSPCEEFHLACCEANGWREREFSQSEYWVTWDENTTQQMWWNISILLTADWSTVALGVYQRHVYEIFWLVSSAKETTTKWTG